MCLFRFAKCFDDQTTNRSQSCKSCYQQNPENDVELSDYQKGFRRMLAAIYSHTGAHILAAPMAHFLAMEGSRFRYSHDYDSLPTHAIENLLLDQTVFMRFERVRGRRIPFCKAHHYLYRPEQMADMCAYDFYQLTQEIDKKQAEEEMLEHFEFQPGHPLSSTKVVIYRRRPVVPVFQWNWLSSCLDFQTPLLENIDQNTDSARELYCRRFMILFCPFRIASDLKRIGNSHEKTLQQAIQNGLVSDEMLEMANNIQDIHNSLHAKMPINILTSETDLTELEMEEGDANSSMTDIDALQINIGNFMAATNATNDLQEESTSFNPKFSKEMETEPNTTIETSLESVIEYQESSTQDESQTSRSQGPEQFPERFFTTTTALNSLFMENFLSFGNNEAECQDEPQEPVTIEPIVANGTWQSIVVWGRKKSLDQEQQIAFEIVTSTYILTFIDEAISEDEQNTVYISQSDALRRFARRRNEETHPLRLFITGPAGAGKCEYISWCHLFYQIHS